MMPKLYNWRPDVIELYSMLMVVKKKKISNLVMSEGQWVNHMFKMLNFDI